MRYHTPIRLIIAHNQRKLINERWRRKICRLIFPKVLSFFNAYVHQLYQYLAHNKIISLGIVFISIETPSKYIPLAVVQPTKWNWLNIHIYLPYTFYPRLSSSVVPKCREIVGDYIKYLQVEHGKQVILPTKKGEGINSQPTKPKEPVVSSGFWFL